MQGPRTAATAWRVIQGIEAAQMIRKGQVLGIALANLVGQAWAFAALLGVKVSVPPSAYRLSEGLVNGATPL